MPDFWATLYLFTVDNQFGLTLCHIANVSRTEVLRVGSTSGATVADVSNIDVFEVGANVVLLS